MAKIVDVEGIGAAYTLKLSEADVKTTERLLELGATPKGRADLAAKTGISGKLILEWVNACDLFRIQGVGSEYADLLEEAGVDTVVELAQRNPANLYAALLACNADKQLCRRLPGKNQVEAWVAQAKTLPRIIEY